ncbi:hypothetical protein MFRU_009g02080 [Monilinia fructicola]|uniref:RING-type domain-containing protein n=2 Tax=Monilinia fructicola TaxID=38448 RepID=A0A5M9K3E4_MONFR|nr:hypothetical protein EYC84_006453 [Monilinia fructicola]KAG4031435.1 hypothetical protein MFRU_009g02080 [Monilinia fructicola]
MNSSSPALASTRMSNHGSRISENTVRNSATKFDTGTRGEIGLKDETDIKVENAIKVERGIKREKKELGEGDAQLAKRFREDLLGMRRSLTCSICDQLLYEPWTLQCGHTYCYSCLCQWFVPNRRKKTCPECRTAVKQIPAPAFLVKHMVEIFMNRGQIMPHDETVEQHKQKHAEETQAVEDDKNTPEGLFKGTFPLHHGELWRDEADGIMRCPSCGHEHEGGPTCESCGAEFDDVYGFSDMSDDDISDLDVGYDDDLQEELEVQMQMGAGDINGFEYHPGGPFMGGPHHQFLRHYHTHNHGYNHDDATDDSENTSYQENSEDEDAGSLEDFVVADDDDSEPVAAPRRVNQRVVTIISDDEDDEIENEDENEECEEDEEDEEDEEEDGDDESEEDEGGAVTSRRRPRPGWTRTSNTPSISALNTEDDNGSSANGSEFGDDDSLETRMRLRASGGWSPLDEGEDDDDEGLAHDHYSGYATTEDERAIDESDSETIGNPNSDAEDDDDREGYSETRRYETGNYQQTLDDYPSSMDGDATPIDYSRERYGESVDFNSEHENSYDYDTDGGQSTNMDRDGDTEMSSPGLPRSSRSVSVNSTYESLGVANEMAEVDDDSSDTSIRPPPRRQPRQNPYVQQYDSRISMLFAEHQNSVRNAHNPGLDAWGDETRNPIRVEAASRSRRRAQYHHQVPSHGNSDTRNNHHRIIPPRGFHRARTPRGSPPPRIVPVSSRAGRLQRHHPRETR